MKRILEDTSFISTVYNEEKSIQDFLESLKAQTVLPGEIIIVDGGSSDSTFTEMENFFNRWADEIQSPICINPAMSRDGGKTGKVIVRLIKKTGANISEGRNTAIGKASGTFISVSDAGCRLDPAWLEEINTDMEKEPGIVNGGMSRSICRSFLQKILALSIMPGLNEVKPESFMPSSRNICFRKSHWEKAGRYPQQLDFGEDMKFNFSLRKQGCTLVFRPRALVYWKMRESFSDIFKQFFRYAKGDALGKMYPLRHLIRFFSGVLFLAIVLAGILVSPWIFIILILLGLVYCFKPYYRLLLRWQGSESCRPAGTVRIAAFLLIPLLLIYIDSAKVFGYLYGLFNKVS